MSLRKFLKFFFNNPLITGIILIICIAISIYYFLLPENTELFINGHRLPFENGKAIALSILISGIFLNIFINLFTGSLQKDKPSDTEVKIPNIENKIYVNTQTEHNTSAENSVENGKFYPTSFFPELKYFEGRETLLKKINTTLGKHQRVRFTIFRALERHF